MVSGGIRGWVFHSKRSLAKGDYWGRGTEQMARLFESWVAFKMKQDGIHTPFLATVPNQQARRMYQELNYLAYKGNEQRASERENRQSNIMSFDEFCKTPESLTGYPYPTLQELEALSPSLGDLFQALAGREKETGSIAMERGNGYRRRPLVQTGKTLFDWADEADRRNSRGRSVDANDDLIAAEVTNKAIDDYVNDYSEYLKQSESIEAELKDITEEDSRRSEIQERLEFEEVQVMEAKNRTIDSLREFYLRNNTAEDAQRIARDMINRVQAEVEIRRRGDVLLRDILDSAPADSINTDREISSDDKVVESEVKTAGGKISYQSLGHLPNGEAGEFSYVERQFSRSGEFSFTGNGRIKDSNDVAYIFRALEDYSIENVFAVFQKGNKAKIVHLGMGGPTVSYANLGTIRSGYDAFGADKIYLVHNHPSGALRPSMQDNALMKCVELAFKDFDIETEGLILDTTSGRYTVFNGNGVNEQFDRPQTGENEITEVYRFDRLERNGAGGTGRIIRSSEDVALFVEDQRLGAGRKVSYLVLSNQGEIIGNFHTDYQSLQDKGLAEEIASVATKFGGVSAVVYGNTEINDASNLSDEVSRHSLKTIKLLDAIKVSNGLNSSARDNGYLREPDSDYGVEKFRDGEAGMSAGVDLYEKTASEGTDTTIFDRPNQTQSGTQSSNSLSYPITSRARGTADEIVDAKLQQFFERASSEALELDKRDRVNELSEKLGVPVRIVENQNDIDNLPSARHRRSKGYWSEKDGVVVVLRNNTDVADVDNTVVHEVVGHKGLRALIGEERFDKFLQEVYSHASDSIRKVIDKKVDELVGEEVDRLRVRKSQARERNGENVNSYYFIDMAEARTEAEAKREQFRKEATEEYMADLGGRIGSEGFEKMSLDELTFWGKIKAKVQQFLDKFMRGLKISKGIILTDKELSYILYKSWQNLRNPNPDVFAKAEDAVMRRKTGWEKSMQSESAKITEENNSFNKQLSRYINGSMTTQKVVKVGKPLGAMRLFLTEAPIIIRQRVLHKANATKHNVDLSQLRDLPSKLAEPIFVFQRDANTIGVLTELKDRDGKNVCVAVELNSSLQSGSKVLEVNDIRSLHGREVANIVLPIVHNNTLKYADIQKGLEWLRSVKSNSQANAVQVLGSEETNPPQNTFADVENLKSNKERPAWRSSASYNYQQEITMQDLNDATKIVENFENPKFNPEDVSEKRTRIEKLRHSAPIEITGDEIEYSSDLKQFKKNALEYGKKLQGEYINEDRGKSVQLQRDRKNGGLKEVLQHDLSDEAHIKSIAAIPEIIRKSIYIETHPNRDIEKNPDVKGYEHYVAGLKIGGEDYTVHSIIAEDKNGQRYYDHKLSHIEKGKLLDFIEAKQPIEQILTPMSGTEPTIRSERKIKELISLLQVDDESAITRFRDGDIGLNETITKMKAEAMRANTDNLKARNVAMRAIGGNLNHLRQAMARQKEYDITTVKSVTDLAKILMENGLLDDISKYETKRILGAVNNVVGKQDVSQYVQKVMDIMVDNQLRIGSKAFGRLLSIKGSRVDARGIEVQGELDPDGQHIAQVVKKSISLTKEVVD